MEDAATIYWMESTINNFRDDIDEVASMIAISAMAGELFLTHKTFAEEILQLAEKRAPSPIAQKVKNRIETREYLDILYRQATVALWSSLESFVYDLVVEWLKHEPSAWNEEAICKIKVSIRDFTSMGEEERRYFIVDNVKQSTGSSLKQGIGVFENLLKSFGLGGEVDNDIRRTIMELSNTRNVIVHKRGIVDKRMTDNCPWLNLQTGERLVISSKKFGEFTSAVGDYIRIIFDRAKNYKMRDQ